VTASTPPGPIAHLRALLVGFHLVAVGLMAVPAPEGAMNRENWKDATVQAELQTWTHKLSHIGISVTVPQLEHHLWGTGRALNQQRTQLLEPFQPYYQFAGTHQSWRMFVAPHRFPAKLEVDIKEKGTWKTIFRQNDPELAWQGQLFNDSRMRSILFRYSWSTYRKHYRQLGRWVANQAGRDFPDARMVRLSWFKYQTLSPEQVRANERVVTQQVRPIELAVNRNARP